MESRTDDSGSFTACQFPDVRDAGLWFTLPSILLKSVLLAIAAYAGGGTFLSGNFYDAVQDFRIGVPGMLLQIFGGYLFVKYLIRK